MNINTEEKGRSVRYPLEFKAKVVATATKENLDEWAITNRFGISLTAARDWVRDKQYILDTYCERQRLKENPTGPIIIHGEKENYELLLEDSVPRKINAEDAVKNLNAANKKIQYLEDKIAYYDALLEVLKINPTEVQKKTAMKQLREPLKPEDKET